MKNSFVGMMQNFVDNHRKADEAGHDLWTWLPSYKVAQKYHGDYAIEYMPPHADIMTEATMYIMELIRGDLDFPPAMREEHKQWFTRCPCGDFCEQRENEEDSDAS